MEGRIMKYIQCGGDYILIDTHTRKIKGFVATLDSPMIHSMFDNETSLRSNVRMSERDHKKHLR